LTILYNPTGGGFIKVGLLYLGLDYYDGKLNKTSHSKAQVFQVFFHQHTYIHGFKSHSKVCIVIPVEGGFLLHDA
jgi:hypothetical protein